MLHPLFRFRQAPNRYQSSGIYSTCLPRIGRNRKDVRYVHFDWRICVRSVNEPLEGDVVYFDVFGQPMVVINTYDAAVALLEARSANTSDRPRIVMADL